MCIIWDVSCVLYCERGGKVRTAGSVRLISAGRKHWLDEENVRNQICCSFQRSVLLPVVNQEKRTHELNIVYLFREAQSAVLVLWETPAVCLPTEPIKGRLYRLQGLFVLKSKLSGFCPYRWCRRSKGMGYVSHLKQLFSEQLPWALMLVMHATSFLVFFLVVCFFPLGMH